MVEVIDHEARASARQALDAIEAHEKHCGERWALARDAISNANMSINAASLHAQASASTLHSRINRLTLTVAAGTIGILVNVVMTIVPKLFGG